jgi:transcriptional regulator with XRE-family HTH domain
MPVLTEQITGRQIIAARVLLGWSQESLAERAHIARSTLIRLENDHPSGRKSVRKAVIQALEQAGAIFLPRGVQVEKNPDSDEGF